VAGEFQISNEGNGKQRQQKGSRERRRERRTLRVDWEPSASALG
jgi:hypothetical protein